MLVGSFNALFQCVSSEIVMIRYSNSLGAMLFLVHEKSNVSEQFRILQYREHIWSGSQDTEAHCKHLVHKELLAGECSITLIITQCPETLSNCVLHAFKA